MKKSIWTLGMCLIITIESGWAQSSNNEIGARTNVLLGDGVPANDILGNGVIWRFYMDNGWIAGATADFYAYDFEAPSALLGIEQDPNVKTIDADGSSTVIGGYFGRRYGDGSDGFDWFWTAGVGAGFPDVKNVTGPTSTGGTFDITVDAKTEFHLMTTLGTFYYFTPTWSATLAARFEHHFIDMTITDAVTGNTMTLDSQSPMGAYLSLNYRF